MSYRFILLALMINYAPVLGQQDLSFYGDVMINAQKAEHRKLAGNKFYSQFKSMISSSDLDKAILDSLDWVSKIEPEDSKFSLYTWQVDHGDFEFKYYGFILLEDGKVYELTDVRRTLEDVAFMTLGNEEWYGALYYDILPYKIGDTEYYMLFGYNVNDKYSKEKIAEILYFEEDVPVFGAEHFIEVRDGMRDILKSRLMLNYSSEARVNLNYNPSLEMVIHDHLIQRMGSLPGQGPTSLPDGSYVGYLRTEKGWKYVEKIFDHIYEDAPVTVPSSQSAPSEVFKTKTKKRERGG